MCSKKQSPLLLIQSQLLKSVDKVATANPAATPVELIAERLNYWLSTPVDQLATTADSKRIRSAQYLIGLLSDIQAETGKGVSRG